MNNPLAKVALESPAPAPDIAAAGHYRPLLREVAICSGRLAQLLRQRFSDDNSAVAVSLRFLEYRYREICGEVPLEYWQDDTCTRVKAGPACHLRQLVERLDLDPLALDLLLLAGLAEEHEGFADILRSLHPTGLPMPTLGLAAQLLCPGTEGRLKLRALLETGAGFPLVTCDLDPPFFTRSLRPVEALWPWLQGVDSWPQSVESRTGLAVTAGLDDWFAEPEVELAVQFIKAGRAVTLLLSGEQPAASINRALALCQRAQVHSRLLRCGHLGETDSLGAEQVRLLQLHCRMRDQVPVLTVDGARALDFSGYPAPVVICADPGSRARLHLDHRPLHCLQVEVPGTAGLRRMWRALLPELASATDQLAARYPFDPVQARSLCADLRVRSQMAQEHLTLAHVAEAVRVRSAGNLSGAIQLIHPQPGWEQLVLPEAQLQQLRDAANRLLLQSRVLDDWKFLQGRRGARGVRLLFSGPPGTGKTLAAEVMAKALDVDLLQVDLSRVVSKWIGETEKNLAEVFAAAESTRAVLFFDEADALFGKRTEVSDAHDRYANLETAYLLSRLERYDGLAILATNYRQNIDTAFCRRLDFILEFQEPGLEERIRLWQCHLPPAAPLGADVNLAELAALFPIVGGHIRNAAVAAAYSAAHAQCAIGRTHFIDAIKREYEKSGKAFREVTRR